MGAKIRPENFKGNENSGRKTIKEELEDAVEKISDEVLIEVAKKKVKLHLDKNLNFKQTKEMALPIVLKGIIERKDFTSGGKPFPILGGNYVHRNNSDKKNREIKEKDKGDTGGDRSVKDNLNPPDSD